jgi:hypothetical protein
VSPAVAAECIACSTLLEVRSAAGRVEVRRRCLCPFAPRGAEWAALPITGKEGDAVECVRAWYEAAS